MKKNLKRKKYYLVVSLFIVIVFFIIKFTGLFVIQPIGAIPEGITIWYWRYDTNLPFVSSPDSISKETIGSVSLLSRGIALTTVMEKINEKIIIKFPYSNTLYLQSTKGSSYQQ